MKNKIYGIIFVLVISLISMAISTLTKDMVNLETLTVAIFLGILIKNTVGYSNKFKSGINFSLKTLLKAGIVLLGFKLTYISLITLGPITIVLVVSYVLIALILATIMSKLFKVNIKLATLIGVGTSICGASAVVAMAPCINAEEDDSVIAVGIVSLLGAIGVIVYTVLVKSGMNFTQIEYGVWSGLSLHGVAHAIAAAFALSNVSGEVGTLVKMARVLMLVPVSIILSYRFNENTKGIKKTKFPIYLLLFIVAGVINSIGILPVKLTNYLQNGSAMFILMAMTAMGLSVDFKSVKNKGVNALFLGTILFILLSTTSLVVIKLLLV